MRGPGPWPLWRGVVGASALLAWVLNMGRGLMPELVQALPFRTIAVALSIFAIGFVAADLTNPTSWLRRWVRWRWRVFDVEDIVPAHTIINGVDHLLITAKLHFVRNAPHASIVLDIQSCKITGGTAALPSSIVYDRDRSFVVGEKVKMVLVTVPVRLASPGEPPPMPLPGAHYGPPDQPSPPPFIADSVNVLTLIVRSGWHTQRYLMHLRSPMLNSSGFGRTFCMGEDYDAFGTVEGPAFH